MKPLLTIVSAIGLTLALSTSAHAKGKKGGKGDKADMKAILATYDTNGNGIIDGDEVTALRKAFDAGDAALKKLDTDGDGKLSDAEIAAVKKHSKKNK